MAKIDLGEIGHFLTRNLTYGAGKEGAHLMGEAIKGSTPVSTIQGTGVAMGAAAGNSLAAIGVLGVTAALSAGLTQMDYVHKKNTIKNLYREELAAKLGKAADKVNSRDLELLAAGDHARGIEANRTVAEELKKAKRIRNFGVFFSFMASVGSLLVVASLDPSMFAAMHGAIEGATTGWLATAAEVITKGAIAVAAYNVIKAPIHWLGDKLFGLDKETTHSRIKVMKDDIEEGKAVTQEQVLAVVISANPELDRKITDKFGDRFDALRYAQKHQIAENIGESIGLKSLTDDINHGRVRPSELAFIAQGDASGVLPKDPEPQQKQGLLKKIRHKLHHAVEHYNTPDFDEAERKIAKQEKADAREMKKSVEGEVEQHSGVSFVERMGRSRIHTELGHVQRLEQSRAGTPLVTTRG